jgi:hypothetical protein
MNEVEALAFAEGVEKSLDLRDWDFRIERLQAGEREDGVVKVRPTATILSGALGRELAAEEFADEFGGIAQQPGRQPGDLEKLQPKTHIQKSLIGMNPSP